jgi:hypothetical protein
MTQRRLLIRSAAVTATFRPHNVLPLHAWHLPAADRGLAHGYRVGGWLHIRCYSLLVQCNSRSLPTKVATPSSQLIDLPSREREVSQRLLTIQSSFTKYLETQFSFSGFFRGPRQSFYRLHLPRISVVLTRHVNYIFRLVVYSFPKGHVISDV